ncbi:PAS domain-containing protein [Neorhizobium huautlense]|uniref:PAS domain-containing protein n=1 Tax=Neorhizobium huautlense TaxID=67774 RepID=A0ABT9Q222_9HYPH|nr:PAS domain-containing protein [Neorhizobium huautlense]MDP9840500.1 PAS domain-containing protein [Neorhizobium huautlense]
MQQPSAFLFETDNIHEVPDAGFFTWDVPDNLLYADGALARLFGIDEVLAEQGLPIEDYLARVHQDDLARLAKAIRDSIVEHTAQQEHYRVLNAAGRYVNVCSFGRGFRDQDGVPVRYVGIVVPAEQSDVHARVSH